MALICSLKEKSHSFPVYVKLDSFKVVGMRVVDRKGNTT